MKRLGIALVILGILALVFGGFHYDTQKTVLDMGPIKATATERHTLPLSPIVAGIAIVGGLVLIVLPRRREG
jgi:hypothetical protein